MVKFLAEQFGTFTVGIARPSDYNAVARLCRRAVGPSDYVLSVLRDVIVGRELFLAFIGKELVGMTNFERCIDGSGWLGMARTDPKWRRKGAAVFLQKKIVRYAKRLGIRTLRFWVLSSNRPALMAAASGGFRPVCEAFHISMRVKRVRDGDRPLPITSRSRELTGSIMGSEYLRKMNGYFAYTWHFVKADERLLEKLVRKRELYQLDSSQFILSKPEKWSVTTYSSFTLLSGPAAPSLHEIRQELRAVRSGIVGCYLPYNRHLIRVARSAGFHLDEWGTHCIVFEKNFS